MKITLETASETELHQILSALTLFLNKPSATLPPMRADVLTTTPAPPPQTQDSREELSEDGKIWLREFVLKWSNGFGDEMADQPDRPKLMTDMMRDHGVSIVSFIKQSEGLTRAIISATREDGWSRQLSRLIAENITQVSSILCPPLAPHLEYPWKFDN